MLKQRAGLAMVVAAALVTSGAVLAAETVGTAPQQTSKQAMAVDKDVRKMSIDGAQAYTDVAMTRLAIFDGRTDDAKKLIGDAVTKIDKAKSDASVFTKAESELKQPSGKTSEATAKPSDRSADKTSEQSAKPVAWLPVDGEIYLDEDFSANPKKAAAAKDANKSLAKGDRAGAIEKLKLADVSVDYIFAVVPLEQTTSDVHKAAELIGSGKYYEASQMLRQVEARTRYDMLDVTGRPAANAKAQAH